MNNQFCKYVTHRALLRCFTGLKDPAIGIASFPGVAQSMRAPYTTMNDISLRSSLDLLHIRTNRRVHFVYQLFSNVPHVQLSRVYADVRR